MPSTIDPRLKKGERYRDFVVIKVNTIEELQCTLYELIHEPSSASIMHLANADSENLFCLSFQTLPKRSDGIAHILEHTVLCGSRKFPVKDPFFSMRRRSLNTFMNALTGADFTCYPAASQVEKDFYNLLDVYLDAVFHPQLKEQSFLQEGHRLEFAEAQNPKSALEHKGIVYNEMKGSLSSPDSRLWHEMMSHLVPDLPYTHNSGGDPRDIPSLTYADLIAFHETYYHPSRCLFFFYGNLPLKKHLDFIAENALKNVLKQPPLPPIPKQKRFSHPLYKETVYPTSEASDLSKKTMLAFGWLTMAVDDQEKVLALSLIDSILMNTDASLLKRPLLQSGLCMQVESYFDAEMSEVPYLIVFKGCEKNHSEKIQKLLFDTLKKIVEETIPLHLIETAIHQTEIARTEIVGDHAPFGLTLFMRSALAKQHGCSPENALMIHALFEDLLKRVKDPHYLGDLIQKILSDNPHFVRLTLLPDPTLTSKEHEQERKILDSIRERLTENDVQKLLAQAASLSAYQKQLEHQSLECLPKVSLDDVPQTSHDFLLRQEIFRNLHIFHHECFTNHFIYADLVFDLPFIAEEDLPYVQLFIALLAELGVGKRDFAANLDYVQAHTGGISASSGLYPQAQDSQLTRPALAIHGKALERKADKLLSLLAETAQLVRVDETARIEELLLQLRSAQQNRLSRNALRYAIQLATSSFSPSLHVSNMWSGLPYYKMIQELTEDPSSHLPRLIEKFTDLKDQLLCLEQPHLVLSCSGALFEELRRKEFFGLAELPLKRFKRWQSAYSPLSPLSQARTIASSVAFNAMAFKTVHLLHPHAPALTCSTYLLDNKILHRKIREEGGAYGCGASYNALFGTFCLQSYRDPHIAETFQTFEKAIESVALGHFDKRDLEEAKLGVVQALDSPISPGSRGLTAYTRWREGRTIEMRQRLREELLALSEKDVRQAIDKELVPKKEQSVAISFAGKELLEQENAKLTHWRESFPILAI